MLRYALSRVFWTIPVLFVAVTLTFFLVRSVGGDPFRHGPLVGLTAQDGGWQKYGDFQPQSIRDNMRRRYGLDLPWYEQYGNYLAGAPSVPDTRTGSLYFLLISNSAPKPPMPPSTPSRMVRLAKGLIASTRASPASISTPASR
jgi:oligopeptide transport system permease protein